MNGRNSILSGQTAADLFEVLKALSFFFRKPLSCILPVASMSGRNALRRVSFNILYKYSPKTTVFGTKMTFHMQNTVPTQELIQFILAVFR